LEKVFGRHTAVIEDDFRVYWAQEGDSPLIAEVLAATDAFAEAVGRRPRILVARMGRVMKTGAEWRVRQRLSRRRRTFDRGHMPADGAGLGTIGMFERARQILLCCRIGGLNR
jgi:hypothetical protein